MVLLSKSPDLAPDPGIFMVLIGLIASVYFIFHVTTVLIVFASLVLLFKYAFGKKIKFIHVLFWGLMGYACGVGCSYLFSSGFASISLNPFINFPLAGITLFTIVHLSRLPKKNS